MCSGCAGDVLENFADAYPLAVGARGALLIVLISCYPKVQHSVRDGFLRLCTDADTDTANFDLFLKVTFCVVFFSTLFGTLIQQVEVVLAYKGAIFGSLMVYIWPALMHSALMLQGERAPGLLADQSEVFLDNRHEPSNNFPTTSSGGLAAAIPPPPLVRSLQANDVTPTQGRDVQGGVVAEVLADGSAHAKPVMIGAVLYAMLTKPSHAGSALLLVWVVVTGCLGVGVTVVRQFHL